MTRRFAIVRRGGLELSEPLEIPDGTAVTVFVERADAAAPGETSPAKSTPLEDPLSDVEEWGADGPVDLSVQHDHYASGAPKRPQ